VSIELDCKLVVDGIAGKPNPRTDFGVLLCACKTLLMLLQNLSISFIQRQDNNVAHFLTRASLSFASYQEFYYLPFCIKTILMNEISSFLL
jgi:hypothetical protein